MNSQGSTYLAVRHKWEEQLLAVLPAHVNITFVWYLSLESFSWSRCINGRPWLEDSHQKYPLETSLESGTWIMNQLFCSTLHTKAMNWQTRLQVPATSWSQALLKTQQWKKISCPKPFRGSFRKFFHAVHCPAACWDKSLGHSYLMGGWNTGYSVRGKYLVPSSTRRQLQTPSYCHLPSWCFVVFPSRGFSGADAHLDIWEGFPSFPFRVSWQITSNRRILCQKCLLVFIY